MTENSNNSSFTIKHQFIVLCLYFFQGQEERAFAVLKRRTPVSKNAEEKGQEKLQYIDVPSEFPNYKVRCLTGDIGLHVEINIKDKDLPFRIRCQRCNQNNEMVTHKKHYYPVKKIQETIVKKMGNSMVYLCTQCDHALSPINEPKYFLSNPYPRYV